jgi:hypothetical protein
MQVNGRGFIVTKGMVQVEQLFENNWFSTHDVVKSMPPFVNYKTASVEAL